MKISTEIDSAAKVVGEQKAVEYCAKAGFDAWDFSMFSMCDYNWGGKYLNPTDHPLAGANYLAFARELKQIGLDNGIHCNQSHAPFPVFCKGIRDMLKRAIECTAEAGGQICVIHPDNDKSPEENAQMYLELLPFAKSMGVKMATENMWNWNKEWKHSVFAACATAQDFVAHVDAVNDPYLVACLDLGHAEMQGSGDGAVNMILALGDRLQALHIHDNDRVNDNHQIPFSMKMDFNAIARALKEIGYPGYFTLEVNAYMANCPEDEVLSRLQDLAASARKFGNMVEEA